MTDQPMYPAQPPQQFPPQAPHAQFQQAPPQFGQQPYAQPPQFQQPPPGSPQHFQPQAQGPQPQFQPQQQPQQFGQQQFQQAQPPAQPPQFQPRVQGSQQQFQQMPPQFGQQPYAQPPQQFPQTQPPEPDQPKPRKKRSIWVLLLLIPVSPFIGLYYLLKGLYWLFLWLMTPVALVLHFVFCAIGLLWYSGVKAAASGRSKYRILQPRYPAFPPFWTGEYWVRLRGHVKDTCEFAAGIAQAFSP